jgi:hypothetical protein
MAGELRLGTGTAPTGTSGYVTPYADTADKKIKSIDVNGVISILANDGLHDRNILYNGGFCVQQRVATASTAIPGITTTTRGGKVADRWAVTTSVASNLNWAKIDTAGAQDVGLQSRYYGSIISSTAGKKVMISQWVLGDDMAHLRGKKVRVSLKHNQKVGSGQTYKLGLLQLQVAGTVDVSPAFLTGAWSTTTGVDPAWGTNLAAIIPDASPTGEGGTITGSYLNCTTVATTWTKSSCVFTVPTNAKNLVPVFFSDATGGTTDNISISEFQMTEGPDLVDYVPELFSIELNRCQRVFCKTFAHATVPVTSAGIDTGEAKGVAGKAGAVANAGIIYWRFPVTMWKTPVTVTLFNPAAGNALQRNLTGVADMGATALTAQLDSSVMAIATGVAATAAGDQIGIHITADAEIVA